MSSQRRTAVLASGRLDSVRFTPKGLPPVSAAHCTSAAAKSSSLSNERGVMKPMQPALTSAAT
jgi:hypothetical protein